MNPATTRRYLHGVAELLLAGPQFRRSDTIRLRTTPGGFGTIKEPDLRVDGTDLVAGDLRVALSGTYSQLAAQVGVQAGAPAHIYHDGSGVALDEEIVLDPTACLRVLGSFAIGDRALREFAPQETPVLWPEHFDVGITISEINYGVSPGDSYSVEPYAYVGPWKPRTGEFWNAPFGAARPLGNLTADDLVAFFRAGHTAAT